MVPLLCVLASAACGGDDGGGTPLGLPDAGTNKMDGSMPMTIPRRDAQTEVVDDPIKRCDRANPAGCTSGEVCDLLIRRGATDMNFFGYWGCVKEARERAEGDPCNPDPSAGEQYVLEGLKDIVFRDACGDGLVCAPNRKVRGAFSCQQACASGNLAGTTPYACADATALCARASQISEYCRKSDGCSVAKQTGCLGGEACYLLPSTDRKQLLAFCSPEPMTAQADGAPDCSPVACKPGSVCLGPVNQPISAWTDTNVMCRPVCNGEMGEAPATSDEDAGLPSGLCSATTRCKAYSESGLLLSSITAPPFGQCEAP